MSERIQVTFVIPNHCKSQNDCSEEMLIAYSACDNHQGGGLKAQWVHESKLNINTELQKKHIFVLSEFEGEIFEQLKSTNCLLIGPRCLSCCLTEGNSIPTKGHPVFTVAMRGLMVTTTGLPKDIKTEIQRKIEFMGGTYSSVLTDATTHLISNNVFSDKYIKATERGIPVMREAWVNAVWEASLKLDVNGSSSDFDCYRLPPFANLQITTSGLSQHDKKLIMKLINSNGGEFSRVFQSQTTNVLVLPKSNIGSEKCKAAIEYGKVCVTPHWIKDSAALGFALPVSRYQICTASTSSPIAENRLPDMSLNFSRINKEGITNNFVNESRLTNIQVLSESTKIYHPMKDASDTDEIQKAFESFDLGNMKNAGPIFDGLCVWVTGLEGVARERAAACVSRGGGVRYDGPHERVTHVVAGAGAAAAAAAALPAVPVLSPLWLLRSVEAGRVVDEHEFMMSTLPATPQKERRPPELASPMSRRNLQLLRAPRPSPPPPPPHASDDQIINHYLSQTLTQSEPTTSIEPLHEDKPVIGTTFINQSEYTKLDIFEDMVIEVQGLEEAAISEIEREIRAAGGVLAAAGAGGAFVLVPLDFDTALLRTPSAEPVTVFWVKDCLSQQALVPIEYYHRAVRVRAAGAAPLRGVVASLSTYTGVERAFLAELAKLLGATTQQRFCRRDTASALASTHLICPEASGAKYEGALKWGVPAVRADWLLACAAAGARVSEAAHSVDAPKGPLTVSAIKDISLPKETICTVPATTQPINVMSEEKENLNDNCKMNTNDKLEEPREILVDKPELNVEEKQEEVHQKKPENKLLEMLKEMRKENPIEKLECIKAPNFKTLTAENPAPGSTRPVTESKVHRSNKNKKQSKTALLRGMSPATRFITMSRLGMLNPDYVDSSKEDSVSNSSSKEESEDSNCEDEADREIRECTALTPNAADVLLTPNLKRLSPSTRRGLQAVKSGEVLSDPIATPINPFAKKITTPDSKIGGQLRPCRKRLSIDARKRLWEIAHSFIDGNQLLSSNDDKDLLDELPPKMAKLTENQCAGGVGVGPGAARGAALPAQVDEQLQLLSSTLTGRRTPRASRTRSSTARSDVEYDSGPESNTIGWDDTTPSQRDINMTSQISEPKRVKSAPAEMIPAPLVEVTDLKENMSEPSRHDDQYKSERISRVAQTINNEEGVNQKYKTAENETDVGGSSSPLKNQNDECKVMKENQCPTEYDEMAKPNPSRTSKLFIVSSNVDNREETVEMIVRLGGAVTDLDEGPPATHLLCAAPARSQRILSSIAAGCWVLHPAYVARSAAAGAFLPEEPYEWGNPSAVSLPAAAGGEAALARAAHRWRARRARGEPGPFAGHAALLHVPAGRHSLLAPFIRAGGGTVVQQQPPYTDESITVCFADPKRHAMTSRDREWLRARRVPVCAPILLSVILTDEQRPDLRAHCLPDFQPLP